LPGGGITSLYTDASVATRLTAITVAKRDKQATTIVLQESIRWVSTCSILTAEIAAIAAALNYAQETSEPEPQQFPFEAQRLRVAIFSDSQYALRAIQVGNNVRSGRPLLLRISESFYTLQEKGVDIEFR
jgi:ribonuclease HI